jgi:hypothetical protein
MLDLHLAQRDGQPAGFQHGLHAQCGLTMRFGAEYTW